VSRKLRADVRSIVQKVNSAMRETPLPDAKDLCRRLDARFRVMDPPGFG